MNQKRFARGFAMLLGLLLLTGCGGEKAPEASPQPPVTLTVVGGWPDCRALEAVGREFTAKYPNCTIEYEYLQDYYASLGKRMSGEDAVDLFFTVNIQEGSELLPYALDLNSCEGLDLSNTFDGLIENFTFRGGDAETKQLYAIPVGAEMRGLYINKTLLDSLNIGIPTDQAALLDACARLKERGYIPFQGNPGDFSQMLLYPWVCNLVANADDPQAAYDKVSAREPGVSELFRKPFEFLYTLVENGYYDYKKSQTELNLFNDSADVDYARYFFNILQDGDSWKKGEGAGQVAFMPAAMSMGSVMDKTREDYHSDIEYVFAPAPVGEEGGFAYLSPAHGIAANKNSASLEWSVKFLDFLFQPAHNKLFAQEFNVIPNTKEAFDYITDLYEIPGSQISQLGQVTFDYGFYEVVTGSLLELSKGNNPKYMQSGEDGTVSLYPLEYYMGRLEESFQGNEE